MPKKTFVKKSPKKNKKKPAKQSAKQTLNKSVKKSILPKNLINEIYNQLNTILDPELGIGIVDLGLIYDVKLEKKSAAAPAAATAIVTMTLTTMGCPVGPMLIEQIETVLTTLFPDEIKSAHVEITWDPPWSPEKMKPEIRELMQGF